MAPVLQQCLQTCRFLQTLQHTGLHTGLVLRMTDADQRAEEERCAS